MNEEQRTVLEAVARLEENRGGPVDEYTVARDIGILGSELSGQDYAQSAEREQIRRLFDELEEMGMVRLDRSGYWRPRTTLAGRRAVQGVTTIGAPTATRTVVFPRQQQVATTTVETVATPVAHDDGAIEGNRGGATRVWPAWWPRALRFGAGPLAPLLALLGLLASLLLIALLAVSVRGGDRPAGPTGTAFVAAPQPTPVAGGAPTPEPTVAPDEGQEPGATPTRPPRRPTPTPPVRRPTPTPGPRAAYVVIANTNREGAFLYATPAGERRFALPDGTELEDIGPDEQDPRGRTWKHVRYGNTDYWILEEYTEPVFEDEEAP